MIDDLPPRFRKAIELLQAGAVKPYVPTVGLFIVTSGDTEYTVSVDGDHYTCDCKWGSNDESRELYNACSHAIAVAGYTDQDVPLRP